MAADTQPIPAQPLGLQRGGAGGRPIASPGDGCAFEAAVADVAAEDGGPGRTAAPERPASEASDPPPGRFAAASAARDGRIGSPAARPDMATGAHGPMKPRAALPDGRAEDERTAVGRDGRTTAGEQPNAGSLPLADGSGPSIGGFAGGVAFEPDAAEREPAAAADLPCTAAAGAAGPPIVAGARGGAPDGSAAPGTAVGRPGAFVGGPTGRRPGDREPGAPVSTGGSSGPAGFPAAAQTGSRVPFAPATDRAVPDLVAPDLATLTALLAAPAAPRDRPGRTGTLSRADDGGSGVAPARARPDADGGAVLRALQAVARGRSDPALADPAGSPVQPGGASAVPGTEPMPDPRGPLPAGWTDGHPRGDGAGLARLAGRIGPAVAATLSASGGPDALERFQAKVLRQETHLPVLVELSIAGQQVADALAGLPPPAATVRTAAADPVRADLTAPPLHVLEIQLQPRELGSVRVELRAAGDRLAVRIVADEPETARLLTEDTGALGRKLEAAGYPADTLLIQVVGDAGLPRLPAPATGPSGHPAAGGGQGQAGSGQPGQGQTPFDLARDGSGRNDDARHDDIPPGGGRAGDGVLWL